jgi:hypothetical protein
MACHLVWSWWNKEKFEEDIIRRIKPVEVIRQRLKSYILADSIMQDGNKV